MRKVEIIIVSCLCLAATSCASLGKYQPVEEMSATAYGNVPGADDSEGLANFTWQEMFSDPILQELITTALENNLDLKMAHEHIAQAEARLTAAKLAYTPTLNAAPNVSGIWYGDRLSAFTKDWDINASSTWQLSIFRMINNQKSAQASVEQMRDWRQATQAQVIAGVANTYYALMMLDSQLATALDMQTAWKESVETVIALKEAGLADQVAVSQYEANLNNINITVTSIKGQIAGTENAMNLLLAREPDTDVARGQLKDQKIPENISSGVPSLMLTLRPDVRAAQRDLELAHYAKRGAILNFFPSLKIDGDAAILTPLVNVVASLTVPIVNAGKNAAELKAAESKQRETELAFTKTLLEAGTEVNDAYVKFNDYRTMAADYLARAKSLDQARNDTEYLMRNSLDKTYLDVLYANTNFLDAKLNAIANQALMLQSVVKLYTALGGGAI